MPERRPEGSAGFASRRGFIKLMSAAAAAALLPRCSEERSALGFRPEAQHVTPFITPNEDFYLVAVDPSFRPGFGPADVEARWHLSVNGTDGRELRLSYAELDERARHKIPHTFECIGNRVGGQLIGNAGWHVLPLRELLKPLAGSDARSVMFEGLDDFYSSVSIERAMDDYAFIALKMNDVPLPGSHGFPARVILPDLYGMKQPRWLRRITVLETADTTSFWEKRGWAGEVPVKTMSRFDPPPDSAAAPVRLNGIAFAGKRGVSGVEVSLDGGEHWERCELVTGEQPHVWSLWRYHWNSPTPGRHTLKVRAVDGEGGIQIAERQGPHPDGASGYHTVDVNIEPRN